MPTPVLVLWSDHAGQGLADALVREGASQAFGVPENAARVVRLCPSCGSSTHGRPLLAPVTGLAVPHVGMGHAGTVSVVALSMAGPVGVDVERSDAAAFAGFPAVALHPAEESQSAQERTVTWVRKEALLKAAGQGVVADPARICLTGPGDPPDLIEWTLPGPPPSAQLYDVDTAPGHVAALAVLSRAALTVVVRKAGRVARSPRARR